MLFRFVLFFVAYQNLLNGRRSMRKLSENRKWNWQIENKLINKYFIIELRAERLSDYDTGNAELFHKRH